MMAPRWCHVVVVSAAALIAVAAARPYAGGWNDGSRLATVEALVDHGDWAIDQSIFVRVPPDGRTRPYAADDAALNRDGTSDLLWIRGRYYSDKSPMPAALLAAEYAAIQRLTGLTASAAPEQFCLALTLGSSGAAFVLAVWSVFRLGEPLRLPLPWRFALAGSFALATLAATYAQHVNNHIFLLATASALTVELAWLANGSTSPFRCIRIGLLMGLSYAIDLGVGPVLFLATAAVVTVRLWRRPWSLVLAALAATPIPLIHHGLNAQIGGTLGPANAVTTSLARPGSHFTAQSMTGGWHHPSVSRFVLYALDMLVGKRGILGHNLPLFLAVAAVPAIWRRCRRERPELLHALAWTVGAWLLYGATSTNSSGVCCSIRWLVPMIAPGYFILGLVLRERPDWRSDFLLLTGWGAIYAGAAAVRGPWRELDPRVHWILVAGAGTCWMMLAWKRRAGRYAVQTQRPQSLAA